MEFVKKVNYKNINNNMKIPKSFTIGTLPYTVSKVKKDEKLNKDNNFGEHSYVRQSITIYNRVSNIPISQEMQELTFFHELIHAILSVMNENELNQNEKFVDGFATLLHQFQITKK